MDRKTIGILSGIIAFILIVSFVNLEPGKPEITYTLAIAALMAIWWISECIPLAITALVPVVLFPLMGVMDGRDISSVYFNHIIFLFIGGFVMALAMEKWELHRRIALKILIHVGVSPGRILMGFMLATAFLSMWISNTAATMMMIPIVLSVVVKLEESIGQKSVSNYATGLFLALAYSSSIGGITTLVGSPTNLICPRIIQLMFPQAPEITFTSWFFFALPISSSMFLAAWAVIYFWYKPRDKWPPLPKETFQTQYNALGRITREQGIVLTLFITLALLWIFRSDIQTDSFTIPGWAALFDKPAWINDGTSAIAIAIVMFLIPAKGKDQFIMDWETAKKLPWNIVLLFGGGFALATGFESSGLAKWFGENMSWAQDIHPYMILAIIILAMSLLTELTSNVASTQMLLPAYAALAVGSGNNPLFFMIPVTIASSLAFMLPTATPPNAIIFGTQRVSIPSMVRTGFMLNFIGVIIVVLFTWLFGDIIFNIQSGVVPEWAIMK
jgi:solute carrier family 13 (sodium-dependent dicarboxylate transporter), member 2/3/5